MQELLFLPLWGLSRVFLGLWGSAWLAQHRAQGGWGQTENNSSGVKEGGRTGSAEVFGNPTNCLYGVLGTEIDPKPSVPKAWRPRSSSSLRCSVAPVLDLPSWCHRLPSHFTEINLPINLPIKP